MTDGQRAEAGRDLRTFDIVSDRSPDAILADLRAAIARREVIGEVSVFGNLPRLSGDVEGPSVRLRVVYDNEFSSWWTQCLGAVTANGNGSLIAADLRQPQGRPVSCFFRLWRTAVLVLASLATVGAALSGEWLTGLWFAGGGALMIPISIFIERVGNRRAAREAGMLQAFLERIAAAHET